MAEYIIESRTRSGQFLAQLPFRDLSSEFYYSKTRAARFTMAKSDLNELTYDDIYPAKTEIVIRRDGVAVFCGPLWDLSISSDGAVKLVAEDLSSYFEKRKINVTEKLIGSYGDMAWGIISDSQSRTNGNLGITRGTTVGAGAPAGYYNAKRGEYISQAHEALADGKNGFDWVFTTDRVYNQYYPRIATRANVRLEYGGNIQSYSNFIQGKYIGNDLLTIGKEGLLSDSVVDTNSQAEYGLMEFVAEQTNADNVPLLNLHNERSLSRRRIPRQEPTIVLNSELVNPLEGDIGYGQITTVVINDGYTQYAQDMQCNGFSMNYGKPGNETFTLYMAEIES